MRQVKLAAEPDPMLSHKMGVWYVWPDGARALVMHGALGLQVMKEEGTWRARLMYPGCHSYIIVVYMRTKNAAILAAERWLYKQAHETLKFLRQRDR